MPLVVNLRHLEEHDVILRGELPVDELDLDTRDEMIRVTRSLRLTLECQCVRCLKPFKRKLELNPWVRHLPFEGEEQVPVVNDCADLTPYVREDMLLELPRHPLCKPDCRGLEKIKTGKAQNTGGKDELIPSAWTELDKLKL